MNSSNVSYSAPAVVVDLRSGYLVRLSYREAIRSIAKGLARAATVAESAKMPATVASSDYAAQYQSAAGYRS